MKVFLIILFIICASVFGAKAYWYPRAEFNYKITVEIETPEGLKTGSAVRQVQATFDMPLNPDIGLMGYNLSVTGEAVVIDLGLRGVVFGLISSDSYYELFGAFPYNGGRGGEATKEGIKYYQSIPAGTKAPLPQKTWSQFVMFKDITDPKSVTLVHGTLLNAKTQKFDPVDDFETIFGKGVLLRSISIEITDEAITWGKVDEYLPEVFYGHPDWWNKLSIEERIRLSELYGFKKGK